MGGGSSKTTTVEQNPTTYNPPTGGGANTSGVSTQRKRKKSYTIPIEVIDRISDAPPQPVTHNGLISDYIIQTPQMKIGQYEEIITKLKESSSSGSLYQDPQFPARLTSLTKDISTFERAEKIVWMRPSKYENLLVSKQKPTTSVSGSSAPVFADALMPCDVKQGNLGNCYFLSVLSGLAEQPKLIRRLFVSNETNPYGCYCIWLCYDGEWTQIIIDDQIPCMQETGPCFSRTDGNELWVTLIEKAYAKIFGAYDKIESGLSGHAMRDLTGAPYTYYIRDGDLSDMNSQDVWKFVTNNFKKKFLLIASSEQNERAITEQQDYLGIISQHCYSILDVREVVGSDGQKDRILKIRNPWGKIEWQGDWSESSSKWTKDLINTLRLKQTMDERYFWISVKDFVNQFSQICVSQVIPEYVYNSYRVSKAPENERLTMKLLSVQVTTKTHGWISVCQRDKRNFAQNQKINYQYSLFRVIVCGVENNAQEVGSFVSDGFECDRDIDVEVNLEPGEYVVYIDVEWVQNFVRDFVVSAYTSRPIAFSEIKIQEKLVDNIIDDIIDLHQVQEELDRVQKYNEHIIRTSGSFCGYIYFFYENNSPNTVLKENIKMKEKHALQICQPYKNGDEISVEVQPGEKQICQFRVHPSGRGQYSYSTNINYILLEIIHDEEILKEKARNNPSKMKQREMNGHLMDVFVHTYVYYGGVAFLYINQTRTQTYIEDLTMALENLQGQALDVDNDVHIQIGPGQEFLLNLQIIDQSRDISYSTKMSYFLR